MISTLILFFVGIPWIASQVFNTKVLFYSNTTRIPYDLIRAENIFDDPNFRTSSPAVFFFHGFNTDADTDTVKQFVNAYTKANSFNILILDWRELANAAYPEVVLNIEKLGTYIVQFMQRMTIKGYLINNWHLVGHSLGAHLAGIVGRQMKSASLILPRITALDPAGPGFYILVVGPKPVNRNDAAFVDVIHTDAGILGAPMNTGTVDFWPNRGLRSQPGCSMFSEIGGCSHGRSIDFWIESVENKDKILFTSQNERDSRIKAQMGLNCSSKLQPGSYKLFTYGSSPYSRV